MATGRYNQALWALEELKAQVINSETHAYGDNREQLATALRNVNSSVSRVFEEHPAAQSEQEAE